MAKFLANSGAITTNGTYLICVVNRRRDADWYKALHFAYGTFGAGTVAWSWSPDGGTTQIPVKNTSGTAITSTAADSFTSEWGNGNKAGDQIGLYATLTGATSPSLFVGVYDNH